MISYCLDISRRFPSFQFLGIGQVGRLKYLTRGPWPALTLIEKQFKNWTVLLFLLFSYFFDNLFLPFTRV